MILWALTMSDPPMCTYKDLHDGTITLEEVVDMTIILQWRAKMVRELQDKK